MSAAFYALKLKLLSVRYVPYPAESNFKTVPAALRLPPNESASDFLLYFPKNFFLLSFVSVPSEPAFFASWESLSGT